MFFFQLLQQIDTTVSSSRSPATATAVIYVFIVLHPLLYSVYMTIGREIDGVNSD